MSDFAHGICLGGKCSVATLLQRGYLFLAKFAQFSPSFEAAHRWHHAPGATGVSHPRKLAAKYRKQVVSTEFFATLKYEK
jgi:hypothetical protein